MRIATFNVNSIRVRESHCLEYLRSSKCDILAIQELKYSEIDVRGFESIGYRLIVNGQEARNGVALVVRDDIYNSLVVDSVEFKVRDFEDENRRFLAATFGDLRVINLYCVNGECIGTDKFEYKLEWFRALTEHLRQELAEYSKLIVLGDFNIIPTADDCYDESKFTKIVGTPQEREIFSRILDLGIYDVFRRLNPSSRHYSWFDYRFFSFKRRKGCRIDMILASEELMFWARKSSILYELRAKDKPSDHCVVEADFNICLPRSRSTRKRSIQNQLIGGGEARRQYGVIKSRVQQPIETVRKGIILAGGLGSRLNPLTKVISKQLLPIYDKPIIYYSLATLMLAGIRDILLISTEIDMPRFQSLLFNGSQLGIRLSYVAQPSPDGLAQALILGERFLGGGDCCLILGDNFFYGANLSAMLKEASVRRSPSVFAYQVSDPGRYGVIELDSENRPISIEEKPLNPKSNFAITGIYFLPNSSVEIAKNLEPSARGELEITDVIRHYLDSVYVYRLGRGFAWLDVGTHKTMFAASQMVALIEERQNLKIACIEEIAYRNGWITKDQLKMLVSNYASSSYGDYIKGLIS